MKLHSETNLDYRHSAIESVCDLFRGQDISRTEFIVTRHALGRYAHESPSQRSKICNCHKLQLVIFQG